MSAPRYSPHPGVSALGDFDADDVLTWVDRGGRRDVFRAPLALIIGAQKCSTGAMRAALGTHRQLTGPEREWHFFDEAPDVERSWPRYVFSPGFRLPLRPDGSPDLDVHTFEKTPGYFDRDNRGRPVPALVRAMLPSARLVVMLRDPIDRAYSAFQMGRRALGVRSPRPEMAAVTFGELIARHCEPGGALPVATSRMFAIGQYARHLERWFAHFPRERFCFVQHARFMARPEVEAARVAAFLGLDPAGFAPARLDEAPGEAGPPDGPTPYRAGYAPMPEADRRRLAAFYAPWNARLRALLPEVDLDW